MYKYLNFKELAMPLIILFLVVTTYLIYLIYPFDRQTIQIGSSYMTMNNEFYPMVNDQVANYVDQKEAFLHNRDPDLSINKQVNQIRNFMAKHVNAIILNPVDGNSKKLIKAVNQAHERGIYIIVVDSELKSKAVDCTIVSDNYHAGVLDAQKLLKTQKQARILLINQKTAISAQKRIKGFVDTIKQAHSSRYKIVDTLYTNGQTETTYPKIKHLIKSGHKFDSVMALNDKTGLGVLAALDEQKIRGVNVYSVDGSKNMKHIIENNPQAKATVAQSPIKMGNTAIKAAFDLINHKKVPKNIILPVHLLDKEKLNQSLLAGWQ